MRVTIFTFLFTALFFSLSGQTPMKQFADKPFVQPQPLQIANTTNIHTSGRLGKSWAPQPMTSMNASHTDVEDFNITPSGSFWIDMKPNQLWQGRSSIADIISAVIPATKTTSQLKTDWQFVGDEADDRGINHIRVNQTLAGIPIHKQDMILHLVNGQLRDLNGFAWTAKLPGEIPSHGNANSALQSAKDFLTSKDVSFQVKANLLGLKLPDDHASLVWYPQSGKLILAYEIDMHPNTLDHWKLFLNASTFEVLESYSQLCTFSPVFNKEPNNCMTDQHDEHGIAEDLTTLFPLLDGASTTTDQDLLGQNRTVNGYQVGSNFFMIDASRNGMYEPTQSVMPNEPVGVLWTIDALNTSPTEQDFEVVHITNTNNNWKSGEVSAHFNAGKAYEYFLQTYNRNSINGSGGNVISIINVADDNGTGLDNAFWNGSAMFYGNGNTSFKELARGLDVAGHEMSHGVIQNTANLEYVGQSGALNESYADVFGSLIDRDDWKIGEDVVKPAVFPSGALRDLSNPNNGGTSLSDRGWQPKHMNEYVNLANTPEEDNGGVHVNSGIPNRAFFLLASSVGREKAEQIYYKALKDYLVKSSQFVDMRLAVEKAAVDLHGASSPELDAVRNAFNTVGIGGGQGGDYEEDIEVNGGADFILATDESESDLYWIPPTNPAQYVKMEVPAPISRPSFTDDGVSCVYVDDQNDMIVINFNWSQGLVFEWGHIESSPQGIWRNVVASKDGSKIAFTTASLSNEIFVYDFATNSEKNFILYNPTTATGGLNTGDVLYPDVMEWDYSGEYIMYDALNRIESNFGDGIEYWDISFLHAWDNAQEDFGSEQIGKLFTALPENVSIGNPSFAKNSPYIIVFDFVETYFDIFGQVQADYLIKAANIEAGEVNDIYLNTTVGYPNYSKGDNKILFTYDDFGTLLLATIDVESDNKIVPIPGTDFGFFTGLQKGIWFATGDREFTATKESESRPLSMNVSPQPVSTWLKVNTEIEMNTADVSIIDLTGRIVLKTSLKADNNLDVSKIASGAYLLRCLSPEGKLYQAKFVKQ